MLGIIYKNKFIEAIKFYIILTFCYAVYIWLLLLSLMLGRKAAEQAVRKETRLWRGQGVIGTYKMSSFLSVTTSDTDVEVMKKLMPLSTKLNKHIPGIV